MCLRILWMKYAGVVLFLLALIVPSFAQYDEGYECLSPVMPGQMGAFESSYLSLYADPLGSGVVLVESLPEKDTFTVLEGPVCPDERDAWIKIDYQGQVGWFLVTQYGLCEVCPDDPPQFWAEMAVKPLVPVMIGPNDPRLASPVNAPAVNALTPANVAALVPLKTWGEGALAGIAWTELGQLRVITATEDRLYDANDLTHPASTQKAWPLGIKTSDGTLTLLLKDWPDTLVLRDTATGQDLAVLDGETGLFDVTGRYLAIEMWGEEPEIRLYDVSQPSQPQLMQTFKGIEDAVVFKDGWLIGADQQTIYALNLQTGEATSFLDFAEAYGLGDGFVDHRLSPDGNRLAMLHRRGPLDMGGGFFEQVLVYGVGQLPPSSVNSYLVLDEPLTEQVQQPQVSDLIWSPDSLTLIVVMTDEQQAYQRRAEDGIFELAWTLNISGVVHAAYSPDGSLIAFATNGGEIHLMRGTEPVAVLTEAIPVNQILDVAFSPDGGILAVAGRDSTLTLWDTQTVQMTHSLLLNTFNSIRLTPDETQVQTARRTYDLATGELTAIVADGSPSATRDMIPDTWGHAALSQDQTLQVVRDEDDTGTIRFYVKDWATGETLRTFEGYFIEAQNPRLSPDNRLLAVFDQATDDYTDGSRMLLFDVQTGDLLDSVVLGTDYVGDATFSGDSKKVLWSTWGNHDQIGIYDLVSQEIKTFDVVPVRSDAGYIALNYDGSLAFTANEEGYLAVWNTGTGEAIDVPALTETQEIKQMIMGKDGAHLYTVNRYGVFKVWGLPE
jgi:WD40 repeat protein